ncbi:MAG: hypothetical protein OER95_14045, partial [Acidimicrobiia bacterium]|nr:hypothetical protein [Acidimicrobiia bacterium]
ACGGRLLDPSGSLALLSVTETEVGVDTTRTVTPPAGAVCLGDPGRIVLGPMRLATSSSGNAVVTIDSRPSGHLLRVLDGDRRETVSRLEVTLAGVGARLTTSNGASPVGMPATITSTDGRRVLTMDGVRPRSVIVECLELDDQDAAGPSLDLPPLMLKILDANRDHPLVPVVGADPADGSLISDRPIELGSLVQLLRHDPLAAVRDVVSRQLGRRGPPPQAALVTSQLPAGPTDQLISDAAGLLGLDLFGTIGPSRPSPGAWSTASLLTLSPRGP